MSKITYEKNRRQLRQLMEKVGCSSLRELSYLSGVSEWQLRRFEHGLMPKMSTETLVNLSNALQVPIAQLLTQFHSDLEIPDYQSFEDSTGELTSLRQEYQHLQKRLENQRETLREEFQQESLDVIESWLLQWPTAEAVARQNPQLPATKLLALVKPVVELLKRWGLEPIHTVGEPVAFDPQIHQLVEGTAQPGDPVIVRYIGYRQGDKLLHRAKVSFPKRNQEEFRSYRSSEVQESATPQGSGVSG